MARRLAIVPSPVALIEDDPFMVELIGEMLATLDVEVEAFNFGNDFFKSESFNKFKIVILDLSLPDIDGFDLMERLAVAYIGMSIVLISGHDVAIVNAAKIYGNSLGLKVRAALTKPFSKEELSLALGLSP